MGAGETGQLIASAAEVYEEFFVPALFAEWPPHVIAAAGVRAGDRVLDVACGTGVLARAACQQVGPDGSVTGLDVNPGMLEVARRKQPEITWENGRAEAMPFENDRFDAVVSQFGLMFFEDRAAAVREMMRVCSPGGQVAVAVWGPLEQAPGFVALAELLNRQFGPEAAAALHVPFNLGDPEQLQAVFQAAGFSQVQIETRVGKARFPSIQDWVFTEIKGWVLADRISDWQVERLVKAAEQDLQGFVQPEGSVAFASPAHIVTLKKE